MSKKHKIIGAFSIISILLGAFIYLKIKLNDDELKSILDEYLNSTRLFRNVYDELYSEKFNKEKTNIDEILYEANSKKYSVLTMLKEKYNVKISDDLYGNIQQALKA